MSMRIFLPLAYIRLHPAGRREKKPTIAVHRVLWITACGKLLLRFSADSSYHENLENSRGAANGGNAGLWITHLHKGLCQEKLSPQDLQKTPGSSMDDLAGNAFSSTKSMKNLT
ncbi:MAG: hypothetical protein IJ392_10715 [Clostridia bacterium]|nr:hypothetical protein [Clostridia bacterium]